MVYDLNGVGLVTGAASGIGKATAFGLAEEGCARLVLADINSSGVELVSSELKSLYPSAQVLCIQVDTSKQTDVQRMVDEAVKTFGAVHYAVNCAGITSNPRVVTHELPVEAWDRVLDVNLRGVWLCQKAVITQMLRQPAELGIKTGTPSQRGSIVNISSILGRVAGPLNGAYAAAKAGVLGLSRTDAVAYGKDSIRVNSVCPGLILTPLLENSIRQGVNYDQMVGSVPIPRWGMAREIAQVCCFLCSSRASYITGEEILVDGGLLHKL